MTVEVTRKLKNYICAYLTAWQTGGGQPAVEQFDGDLPADWEFYVKNGLYASEKFYADFLEANGISQLPDLLRVMDELQEHRQCIFLTDDDPRRIPFPPAFQAAFVEVAERDAVSDDVAKRKRVRTVFETLQSLGMTRIHQSAASNDYHVLSIANWLSFSDRIDRKEFAQLDEDSRRVEFYHECTVAYAKAWLRILYEMEEWSGTDWPFSRVNEVYKERNISDWMHDLRANGRYKSSCVYLRCLESTDIQWLPHLLLYIYIDDKYRVSEYFSLTFERALAKFCRHYATEIHKPENYLSLAKALTILNKYYGMTILHEGGTRIEPSLDNMICSGIWKPTLEEYARVGMQSSDFDVESWIDTFKKLYNSAKMSTKDNREGRKDRDSDQVSQENRPREWFHAGMAVYRRIRGLGGAESSLGYWWPWRMKSPSLFVYPSRAYNIFMSLFAGVFISVLAYGIKHRIGLTTDYWPWIGMLIGSALCVLLIRELHVFLSCRASDAAIKDFGGLVLLTLLGPGSVFTVIYGIKNPANCWALVINYWAWIGVMIGSALCVFLVREFNVFLSCCAYAATINRESWGKDEASYLAECQKEYCLNSYGGNIIEGPEFKYAARCSAVLSRLVGWIGPILEAYGDGVILHEIIGVSNSAQLSLFREALPHAGKEWPLPLKKSWSRDDKSLPPDADNDFNIVKILAKNRGAEAEVKD